MDKMHPPDVEARIARAKELRQALGAFATGVTVVTTVGDEGKLLDRLGDVLDAREDE